MADDKLPFTRLPVRVQNAWEAATGASDPLGSGRAAVRAAGSRALVKEALQRYFGWLVSTGAGPVDGAPRDLITVDRVANWLATAGRDWAPATCYTRANALKLFLDWTDPDADTRALQELANAHRRAISRHDAWKLALPDLDQIIDTGLTLVNGAIAEGDMTRADARQARDGLLLALMGWAPKRVGDLARLTLGDHVRRTGGELCLLVKPQKAGQRAATRPIPLPPDITAALEDYLNHAWPRLTGRPPPGIPTRADRPGGGPGTTGATSAWGAPLWPSCSVIGGPTGKPMTATALSNRVADVTTAALGRRLRPRAFRHLVASSLGPERSVGDIAARLDHVSEGRMVTQTYRTPDRRAAIRRVGLFR